MKINNKFFIVREVILPKGQKEKYYDLNNRDIKINIYKYEPVAFLSRNYHSLNDIRRYLWKERTHNNTNALIINRKVFLDRTKKFILTSFRFFFFFFFILSFLFIYFSLIFLMYLRNVFKKRRCIAWLISSL